MSWNSLVGFGLLRYGYRDLAAELVGRLMDAITRSLEETGTFRKHYDANTGAGIGERNVLDGLPPLGLFLAALGLKIFSPWKVSLRGPNPFPWPVTVRFRGLVVQCTRQSTRVSFPSGQVVEVSAVEMPCLVEGRA